MGDYNIKLLNTDKYLQTVTLIDNIFINDLGKVETMSFFDISDYYPIFHITKTSVEICDLNIIKKRQFNDIRISQLRRNLSTHDWSKLYLINDP